MRNFTLPPFSCVRALTAATLGLWLAACSTLPSSSPAPSRPATTSKPVHHPADNTFEFVTILPDPELLAILEADDLPPVALTPEDLARFGDVWERMRHGFKMDLSIDNDRIAAQRNWFLQRSDYLDRISARASRYLFHTVVEAEKRGVPAELALLPVIESSYNPFAQSHAQAVGMWQFIPSTGRIFGLQQNWWYDGRRDIVASTQAAYEFLGKLYEKFGDWSLALAAYNAGPGAVQRAINQNEAAGLPTDFWSLRLPAETMSYVPRFLAVAQLVQDPAKYGLGEIAPVVNQPHFREVTSGSQIDLAKAADLAGIPLKELQQLNPGYNRWATAPDGPHRLLVPIETADDFESRLTLLPPPERVMVQHYRVKRGDTLMRIAARHNLSAAELKRLNKLKGNTVKAGQMLVISQSQARSEAYSLSQDQRLARNTTGKGKSYTVKAGDTLYSIARRHGVTVGDITQANNLGSNDGIRPGQQLRINGDDNGSAPRVSSSGSRRNDVRQIRYEVKKGDTLFKIANRYNVSVRQIKNWNSASHHIQPGQDLVLFVASSNRGRSSEL